MNETKLCGIALCAYCFLAVTQLGHYSLWDDEANTALGAKAFLLHGDTDARVDGRNLLLYREGSETKDLKLRYIPPLQYIIAAVGIGCDNKSAAAGRAPFLCAGLAAVAILLMWALRRQQLVSSVFVVLLLTNTSLLLFIRQCRYPAVTVLLAVLIAWIYLEQRSSLWNGSLLALCFTALGCTQYLIFAATLTCLVVDYSVWGRDGGRWPVWPFLASLFCGVVISIPVMITWNPLDKTVVDQAYGNTMLQRVVLFFWNLRDLNWCEFASLPLILAGVLLLTGPVRREVIRGITAIVVYVGVISVISPQPVSLTRVADVRYLVPLIPLALGVQALIIARLLPQHRQWTLAAAAIIGSTNLGNVTWCPDGSVHCTVGEYVGELVEPADDPYGAVSDWLKKNTAEGTTVLVLPDYATYPLMFHAPHVTYAWQLGDRQRYDPQFASLSDINFKGIVPPDYIVGFGPHRAQAVTVCAVLAQRGCKCEEVVRLRVFWRDTYRPELFLRTFGPVKGYDPENEGVFIIRCSNVKEGGETSAVNPLPES